MDVLALVLLVLPVFLVVRVELELDVVHFVLELLDLDGLEALDVAQFLQDAVDFRVGVEDEVVPEVFFVSFLFEFLGPSEDGLNIGQ